MKEATKINTSKNEKVFQFPANEETYDEYIKDKILNDELILNTESEESGEAEDESFEAINKAVLNHIDDLDNKEKTEKTEKTDIVPSNNVVNLQKTTKKSDTKTQTATKSYSYGKNYNEKGTKNNTSFKEFVRWCMPTQKELKYLLQKELLKSGYTDVISADGFIYAKGNIPVLLTAHMDTVHHKCIEDFYEYYDKDKNQHILSSPQGIGGDDRCGIYMILQIIKTHKCSVLFCEDEEIGSVGSKKFVKTEFINELKNLKYMIELDRMNGKDAVFYNCDNPEFTKFIEKNTGYKDSWGSFSDISTLAPAAEIAAVNLSCGYYNAHQTSEYVIVEEMLNTINVVKKLLDVDCQQFKYIAKKYSYGNYYGGRNGYGYGWDDDYYDDYWYGHGYGGYGNGNNKEKPKTITIFIYLYEKTEDQTNHRTYLSVGSSVEEAFGKFFIDESEYCFNDIADYDEYEEDYGFEGWLYY